MRGAHLLFYSHEATYKMTYDCWLDTRQVDAVYFAARAGILTDEQKSKRENDHSFLLQSLTLVTLVKRLKQASTTRLTHLLSSPLLM